MLRPLSAKPWRPRPLFWLIKKKEVRPEPLPECIAAMLVLVVELASLTRHV
jgi:hypothetical protein